MRLGYGNGLTHGHLLSFPEPSAQKGKKFLQCGEAEHIARVGTLELCAPRKGVVLPPDPQKIGMVAAFRTIVNI